MTADQNPPGAPGMSPRWTSSAKSGVGTAQSAASRVWFTISHGILNEIYYPRVDTACTRDLGFIVTDGKSYFSEEKRHARSTVSALEPGVPAFHLANTAMDGRYRIEKQILTDPQRDVLLQQVSFTPLDGGQDYRLYALLAPHLANVGADNTAWVADYKGTPMLFAQGRHGITLALASSVPWRARSVGYVGTSDGWQELMRHGYLATCYQRAETGNVALTGEIDLKPEGGRFLLALAFASHPEEAAQRALASLQDGFESISTRYVAGWRAWQGGLVPLDRPNNARNLNPYRVSTAILATHQPLSFPGAAIASLSIPWGFDKGDEDLGGYHLVWPRDLVETAGGFLAAGAVSEARSVLNYLQSVQEADGHWSQNMWLDGTPYWSGTQMDECGLPVLLVDLLYREGALARDELVRYLPMVEAAASYILRNGPVTGQDRWEEDSGYSPFTLAVEITALLAAADLLDLHGFSAKAAFVRETADQWNDEIERWTFATGTEICKRLGLSGYYVRIAPPDQADAASPLAGFVPIKNRPPAEATSPAILMVSPDALALVRFGLRAANDPRILDTVAAIDEHLRVELPQGPLWRRYNGDGYGEHADGSSFDGTGIGRAWPLLAGERAHYELAAGRPNKAAALLATMEASASDGGLLPEQTWDAPDIPARELFFGRPSGSAMPLVWAHAEHIKLLRSLADGRVFDMPPQPVTRYQQEGVRSVLRSWRPSQKRATIPAGTSLRIELPQAAIVHWTTDGWRTTHDTPTQDTGLGIHIADLPLANADIDARCRFTLRWRDTDRWESENHEVAITTPAS